MKDCVAKFLQRTWCILARDSKKAWYDMVQYARNMYL